MYIPALLIGRKGSVGFPGKNTYNVLGKPLFMWVIEHALMSNIDDIYVSTNDEIIQNSIIEKYSMTFTKPAKMPLIIDRPEKLCTKEALGEDVFKHGYEWIRNWKGKDFEMMVLLFCNAVTFTPNMIDKGIELLKENPDADSAISVSQYNWYAPMRARKIKNGYLEPFVPITGNVTCDRDSQGDCYFADCCVSVIRTKNLLNMKNNMPPQRWMGNKILPIYNEGGLDIDKHFQLPLIENYLKRMGY